MTVHSQKGFHSFSKDGLFISFGYQKPVPSHITDTHDSIFLDQLEADTHLAKNGSSIVRDASSVEKPAHKPANKKQFERRSDSGFKYSTL